MLEGIALHETDPGYSLLDELNGDAAERPEVGVQRVALLREYDAGEGAGEHDMPRLERGADAAELVGEPGDAERRMAKHAGGQTRLFDLGVTVHDAADPAQIDIQRTHGAPAK